MINFSGERFPDGSYRQLLDKDQANKFAKGIYDMLYEADGKPRLPDATLALQGEARAQVNFGGRKIGGPCKVSAVEFKAIDGKVEVIARTPDEIPATLEFSSPWSAVTTTNGAAGMQKRTGTMKRKPYGKRKAKAEAAEQPASH